VELRYQLKSMVKNLGLTAIHVTHDQREAMIVADRIVVLRAGRSEQIGTPFHVYQRPENLFVANFVGDTNFLDGTVSKADSTGSHVELRGSLNVRVQETSFLTSERVILTIRQELTSVKAHGWEGVNALPGTVLAVRFLGDYLRIEIRLMNGDEVGAKVPITNIDTYPNIGEEVVVSFKPSDVSVYTHPPRGLAKEIEVV